MTASSRAYKVFANVTGLVLFELVFWSSVVALAILLRKVAPQLDLHYPGAWPALLVAPVGLLLFAGHYRWKQRRMADAAELELSRSLWPDARPRRAVWKFLVWRTGIALLAVGLMDPKWGTRMEEMESEGVDIMIALDVSRSMLTEDVGVARLDLAKRSIERVVQQLDGDRVGLIVFAGEAYVQAPLTQDLTAVKLFLDAIGTETVPLQGTAVGAALALAMDSFDPESQASRVVLVLTDGENHEDDALARTSEAAERGISVHTVGMASEAGGPIPEYDRYGRSKGYKTDESGQPVVSTLDERMLVAMAEAGQGTYVRANQGFVDLEPFLSSLDGMEQGQGSTVAYTDYRHQYATFFLIGFLLLMLEGAWPTGRVRLRGMGLALGLVLVAGTTSAQTGLGSKEEAVAGSQAMVDRDFPAADSLFRAAAGWEGAEPGQLEMNRGLAQASAGQGEDALKSFQRAAAEAESPHVKADAWNNVGNVLLAGQDAQGAVQAYMNSLRLDPTDADTRYNLALAKAMLQEQQEQERDDEHVLDGWQRIQDAHNSDLESRVAANHPERAQDSD